MKAIIFGANGQDGYYLTRLLENQKVEVIGVSRGGGGLIGDVSDRVFVEDLIRTEKPEYIFHLAANSTMRHEVLFENHASISTGTLNILEAVRLHSPNSKVFLSGSAMQFQNDGEPIDENTPFAALNPYAVSRIQSVYAGRYFRSLGLPVYVGYFFNHDSPRRTPRHVNKLIANAAKRGEKIAIGDWTVRKEFTFAGETVAAVWTLVKQADVFEAVIGSGRVHSIEEWIEACYSTVGKDWRQYVSQRENYTAEYRVLVSNPALIKSLGWEPRTSIDELARMMIDEGE
ncbi:MAG: epimerase [Acidobacteria bacterium]|nr:MAG: epimerase [Acidobacteriota bacterium]